MIVKILSGAANLKLATAIAGARGTQTVQRRLERFPDGELHIELQETVRGQDVYLIQPTSPPVDEHLFELLFLADACRRAGAARLTAVIPYFGYARQDRRAHGREPLSARLVAELIQVSGIERIVTVDLHSRAVESAFAIPLEHLSAVPMLAKAVRPAVNRNAVVVAPDLGAAKMAEQYADMLDLPVAIVHKTRISGEQVKVQRIIGDVRGKELLVVDDMISTGGTIEKAIQALLGAGCSSFGIKVLASHGLFVGAAAERLSALAIDELYVSDSVLAREQFSLPLQVVSLAPLLADAIHCLNEDESLARIIAAK
jgi:ribose-phosphate pyrophosphokinase